METGVVAQWGATGIIFFALVFSMIKNGRAQKGRDLKIAEAAAAREAVTDEKLKNIRTSINSPKYGLEALNENIGEIKTNCARVTEGFKVKIDALEENQKGGRS